MSSFARYLRPAAVALVIFGSGTAFAQTFNQYATTNPGNEAFTFSNLSISPYNVGEISSVTSYADIVTRSTTATDASFVQTLNTYTVVGLAPTATTAGRLDTFNLNQYQGTTVLTQSYQETASINVTTDSAMAAGNKSIIISGTIQAKDDLGIGHLSNSNNINLTFSAVANGTNTVSGFTLGDFSFTSPNGSTSFYGSTANGRLTQLASSTTFDPVTNTYSASTTPLGNSATLTLAAGQSVKFTAAITATDGASIDDVTLNIAGSTYDFASGVNNVGGLYTQGVFVSSSVIPAVPEPETYAMLLAGLGLIGAIARRRKVKQA